MNNHYTTIIHAVRKSLDITLSEYCVVDLIRKLAGSPNAPVPGWFAGKREDLADALDISRQGLYKMLNKLFAVGVVEESGNGMLRHTQKWYQLTEIDTKELIEADDKIAKERDAEKRVKKIRRKQSLHNVTGFDVNGVDTERKQSLRESVNGVDTERKQSLPSKGLMIVSDSDLGETDESENEFSPTTDDDGAQYFTVETHEPPKREVVRLEVSEMETTSNGARRDVLGDEFADVMATQFGAKIVTVQTAEPIPESLGKPRKAKRQSPPAHMTAWRPLDVEAEIESLKYDYTVKEAVTLSRKVPAEKFDGYVGAFALEVRTAQKPYPNRAEFRAHFLNFCAARHRAEQKEQANAAKPINKAVAQQQELGRGLAEYYAARRLATLE